MPKRPPKQAAGATWIATKDLPLADLERFPGNARRGNLAEIRKSIRRHGQYRAICVRDTGQGYMILAGNHTADALAAEGRETARCDIIQCTDDEARRINLADNRLSDIALDDNGSLAELLSYLDEDYEGTGWDAAAVEALFTPPEPEPDGDPDGAPEPPAEPVSVLGDLYLLGAHRLLCGDAADVTAHDRLLAGERPELIFTDPPYGMHLNTAYSGVFKDNLHGASDYRAVEGDDQPYDAGPLVALYDDVAEQFWWGADYYRTTIPGGGSWIVWDKRGNEQGMELDKVPGAHFELCWSRQQHHREIARILWSGHHGMQGEDTKKRVHPTQKPVALAAWFFERWRGDIVLDLYGGSGSTLIAAHQASRQARLMEIDPAYCDVICQRFEEHAGIKPERVLEDGTTEPVSFTGK